jgi:DNA recombination protein RmuC
MDTAMISTVALIVSGITFAAVLVLIAVVLTRRQITPHEVGSAISETWVRLGLGQVIGRVEAQAQEIRKTYTTLEQLLRSPTERASFGELALEVLLADQLPASYFGIREKCFRGKIPDAHIKAPEGLICIDSKFPLDNFARMCSCKEDEKEREAFLKQFLKDAEKHLKKVADDYIQPSYGTAAFAFVYIPSEAVYYTVAGPESPHRC